MQKCKSAGGLCKKEVNLREQREFKKGDRGTEGGRESMIESRAGSRAEPRVGSRVRGILVWETGRGRESFSQILSLFDIIVNERLWSAGFAVPALGRVGIVSRSSRQLGWHAVPTLPEAEPFPIRQPLFPLLGRGVASPRPPVTECKAEPCPYPRALLARGS